MSDLRDGLRRLVETWRKESDAIDERSDDLRRVNGKDELAARLDHDAWRLRQCARELDALLASPQAEGWQFQCSADAELDDDPAPRVDLTIEQAISQWFTQGGRSEYGDIGTPQSADELISEILQRVRSASPQAEGWQPIASAPKDGTWLLVHGATWDVEQHAPHVEIIKWSARGGWVTQWGDDVSAPTHWLPLPPAPETQETK